MSDTSHPTAATAPQKIAIAQRRALALTLRKQGGSFRDIADALRKQPGVSAGYSPSNAYRDVRDELDRLNKQNSETAEQVRRLELERLDTLHAKLWPMALKGDFAAFDRVLSLMDRRDRYLGISKLPPVGLELSGAVGVTHSGPNGGPVPLAMVELDAIIAKVYAQDGDGKPGPVGQSDADAGDGADAGGGEGGGLPS